MGNQVSINYTLNKAKKTKKRKLLLLIPDYGQQTAFYKSPLMKELFDQNYQLLLPERRGSNFSTKTVYENYDQRIEHISNLVQSLLAESRIDTSLHFVIYGIGEGSYVAAGLIKNLKPDYFILQNNGAHHFLHETLQVLNSADTSKIKQIENTALLNATTLKAFIDKAYEKGFSNGVFYGKRTTGWYSYTQQNLTESLFEHHVKGVQLIDTNYTYLHSQSIPDFLKIWSLRNPQMDTLHLTEPLFERKFEDKPKDEALLKLFEQ
jgi:hypothetical protein